MFVIMILIHFHSLIGQAQVYYGGKSQYIGVFDTKVEASLAYEIARKLLHHDPDEVVSPSGEEIKANIGLARKAGSMGIKLMKESRELNFATASWPVRWG